MCTLTPLPDLDVDSNYDGSINGTDESLETSAGGVVALGKRVPIRITTQGNLGTVSLSAVYGGEKISVWSASSSGTQIQLGQPLSIGTTYTYYVQGISTSSEVRDIELRLRNTYGTVNLDDYIRLTVVNPTVDLTAYRPTTELPAYGNPFQRTAVPDDEEESPGAGIRVNGDSESGANENDLIEVQLDVAPFPIPSGLTYVLKRNNPNIKVWDSQTMSTALLDSGTEAAITIGSSPMSVWVENPSGGDADLDLVARSGSTDVCSDKIHFYDFTSIVIALGGEGQDNPTDPAGANEGTFQLAVDLYRQGYDVHMYDEDNVGNNGAGAVYDEVVSAIQNRNVTEVAIFGYSHGGGSTHDLAEQLDNNRATIGTFSIPFTAYIDAVAQPLAFEENRQPPSSAFHVNYYQEGALVGQWADGDLDGGPMDNPPGADHEVNVDAGGQTHTHFTIDDDANVLNGIETRLTPRVTK